MLVAYLGSKIFSSTTQTGKTQLWAKLQNGGYQLPLAIAI